MQRKSAGYLPSDSSQFTLDEQSRPVYQKDKFNSRVKMPTNTFKFIQFLILFIALFEPNTCAVVKPQSNGEQPLNSEASQTDDRFLLDKFDKYKRVDKAHQLDRLKADEQSLSSGFVPFELNENTEENTKNVVLWTPENYPNPFVDYKNCSLKERGYICDPDDILEEEDIIAIGSNGFQPEACAIRHANKNGLTDDLISMHIWKIFGKFI